MGLSNQKQIVIFGLLYAFRVSSLVMPISCIQRGRVGLRFRRSAVGEGLSDVSETVRPGFIIDAAEEARREAEINAAAALTATASLPFESSANVEKVSNQYFNTHTQICCRLVTTSSADIISLQTHHFFFLFFMNWRAAAIDSQTHYDSPLLLLLLLLLPH